MIIVLAFERLMQEDYWKQNTNLRYLVRSCLRKTRGGERTRHLSGGGTYHELFGAFSSIWLESIKNTLRSVSWEETPSVTGWWGSGTGFCELHTVLLSLPEEIVLPALWALMDLATLWVCGFGEVETESQPILAQLALCLAHRLDSQDHLNLDSVTKSTSSSALFCATWGLDKSASCVFNQVIVKETLDRVWLRIKSRVMLPAAFFLAGHLADSDGSDHLITP